MMCVGCAKNDAYLTQAPSKENSSPNITSKENLNTNKIQSSSENILPVQKSSPKKIPKWTAGNYKGLQLGKSTVKDIIRIFGEPKRIGNPEDEYDNPIESQLDYIYEIDNKTGEPAQIIFDKKSWIVREVWGGDFSTFKEAIEKHGDDYFEVEFTEKGCSFKEYKEKQDRKFPLNIAYPQKGFYFYLNNKYEVTNIYYVDKCKWKI